MMMRTIMLRSEASGEGETETAENLEFLYFLLPSLKCKVNLTKEVKVKLKLKLTASLQSIGMRDDVFFSGRGSIGSSSFIKMQIKVRQIILV